MRAERKASNGGVSMAEELRVGMVGLDSSKCEIFASYLNNEGDEYHIPGARLVAAYPWASPNLPASPDRARGIAEGLAAGFGVEICRTLSKLLKKVDALLLMSADGRRHRYQLSRLAKGKPLFIDQPFATSSRDARAMIEKGEATGTPLMSASPQRYAPGISGIVEPGEPILMCEAFGPAPIQEDFPGLFWSGTHIAEILYSFMGPGCQQVQCISHKEVDIVIGEWTDKRIGILRGTRFEQRPFGCLLHTKAGVKQGTAKRIPSSESLLMQQIIAFFRSGNAPVSLQETYELTAFVEAANESRSGSGKKVELVPAPGRS
jgi:hypothetical protein